LFLQGYTWIQTSKLECNRGFADSEKYVVRQFQGQHIFFKGNEVHVYLRYSVFVEQVVFVQLLITLNGSSRHKQDVDVFVVLFLPVVTLEDDLIHCLDSWAHDEHNAGVLRLVHKFV
jgi:hypothetical protein